MQYENADLESAYVSFSAFATVVFRSEQKEIHQITKQKRREVKL